VKRIRRFLRTTLYGGVRTKKERVGRDHDMGMVKLTVVATHLFP